MDLDTVTLGVGFQGSFGLGRFFESGHWILLVFQWIWFSVFLLVLDDWKTKIICISLTL